MKKELYLGLDVHQEMIMRARAQAGRQGEVRASGALSNDLWRIRTGRVEAQTLGFTQ